MGEVEAVRVESPTLFDTAHSIPGMFASPGTQPTSGIYSITIPDVHPTDAEGQEILITVLSAAPTTYEPPIPGPVYPEDAHLAAYTLVEVPIESAFVHVTTPNGGEEWQEGSDQTIEWMWVGDIPQVDIHLSTDSGGTYSIELVGGVPNTGSWEWENISGATDQARIRISSSSNPDIKDESNEDFAISSDPRDPDGDPADTGILAGCEDQTEGTLEIALTVTGNDPNDCTLPEDLTYEWYSYHEGNLLQGRTADPGPDIVIGGLLPGDWKVYVRAVDEAENKDPDPAYCAFYVEVDPCDPDLDPPETTILAGCEDPPQGEYDVKLRLEGSDPYDCTPPEPLYFQVKLYYNSCRVPEGFRTRTTVLLRRVHGSAGRSGLLGRQAWLAWPGGRGILLHRGR